MHSNGRTTGGAGLAGAQDQSAARSTPNAPASSARPSIVPWLIVTAVLSLTVLYLGLGVIPQTRELLATTERLRAAERDHSDMIVRARQLQISQQAESLRMADELLKVLERAKERAP